MRLLLVLHWAGLHNAAGTDFLLRNHETWLTALISSVNGMNCRSLESSFEWNAFVVLKLNPRPQIFSVVRLQNRFDRRNDSPAYVFQWMDNNNPPQIAKSGPLSDCMWHISPYILISYQCFRASKSLGVSTFLSLNFVMSLLKLKLPIFIRQEAIG
jgi:hypothetical protein